MKKFTALVVVAVSFLSPLDSSEAQVLRRFRNNIREAIIPQALPQQQIQALDSLQPQARILPQLRAQPQSRILPQLRVQPQPQVRIQPQVRVQAQPQVRVQAQPQVRVQAQPQVRIQRPASPRVISGPQQLTPYSRLTPQQRVSVPQPQLDRGPRLVAPAPVGSPSVQSTGGTKIRVVTYLDPRSGQTFQRRFLLPGNSPAGVTRAPQGQIVAGRRSIFTQPTIVNTPVTGLAVNPTAGSIPVSNPSIEQSLVPPIQFAPQITQQPVSVAPELQPALVGPALAAPAAQPIAASVDNFGNSVQTESASGVVQTASAEIETTPTGIPDLSGLTVDPAPADTTFVDPAPADTTFVDLDLADTASVDLAPVTVDDMAPGEDVIEDAPAEEDQDLFFDDDSADETVEVSVDETTDAGDSNYSVFEEVEEE